MKNDSKFSRHSIFFVALALREFIVVVVVVDDDDAKRLKQI